VKKMKLPQHELFFIPECPISLEAIEFPVETLCSHVFEAAHIYTWIEQHSNCPLCKAPVVDSDLEFNQDLYDKIQMAKSIPTAQPALVFSALKPIIENEPKKAEDLDPEYAQILAKHFMLKELQENFDAKYAQALQEEYGRATPNF